MSVFFQYYVALLFIKQAELLFLDHFLYFNRLVCFFSDPAKVVWYKNALESPAQHTLTHLHKHTHTHSEHTPCTQVLIPSTFLPRHFRTCSPMKIDVLDFSVALQQSLPQAQSPSAYLCHFNGGESSLLRKKSCNFISVNCSFTVKKIPFIPPLFLLVCKWLNRALSDLQLNTSSLSLKTELVFRTKSRMSSSVFPPVIIPFLPHKLFS